MLNRSVNFLTNTEKFLANWVDLGHDTCHKTEGYDVTPCYKDCKEREKSEFAEKCREEGGLFKCCIRCHLHVLSPFFGPGEDNLLRFTFCS